MAFLVSIQSMGLAKSDKAPGDVIVDRVGEGEKAYNQATFPHWIHAIRYRCFACHPAPYKMVKFKLEKGALKQDRPPFVLPAEQKAPDKDDAKTEEDKKDKGKAKKAEAGPKKDTADKAKVARGRMHGEESCGLCHNGKTAFKVEFATCARCHLK